jgi:lactoylglutathione lyase
MGEARENPEKMARDTFGATGLAVSDLDRSVDFYTRVLGMKELMRSALPNMNEVVVGFGGPQAAIVLMNYIDDSNPNYHDNPGKLVFFFVDPVAAAERIRAEGLEIVREPTAIAEMGGTVVGFARDPDGNLLELLQARPPRE